MYHNGTIRYWAVYTVENKTLKKNTARKKKKKNPVRALMELTIEERAEDSEKQVWGSVLGGL